MITDKQLEALEGFIGYGRIDANIVFIGIEEGGGGYENLRMRANTSNYKYVDCKRFHLDKLKVTHLHNDCEKYPVEFQPVWRFMSYLMLRLKGNSKEKIMSNNKQLLREYQNNYLGTIKEEGDTLLTELYPIPCKNYKMWGVDNEPYTQIIPQYKSKKDYKRYVLPKRKKIFEQMINSNDFKASAIICYGKGNWKDFEEFFGYFGVQFEEMNTSKECKIGLLNRKLKIFLTPFLGQGQMDYQTLEELKIEIESDAIIS